MDRIGSTHVRIAGGDADGSTVIAEGSLAIIPEYDIVAVGRIDDVSASSTQDRVMVGMRVDRIAGTLGWIDGLDVYQLVVGRVEGGLATVTDDHVVTGMGIDGIGGVTAEYHVTALARGDDVVTTDTVAGIEAGDLDELQVVDASIAIGGEGSLAHVTQDNVTQDVGILGVAATAGQGIDSLATEQDILAQATVDVIVVAMEGSDRGDLVLACVTVGNERGIKDRRGIVTDQDVVARVGDCRTVVVVGDIDVVGTITTQCHIIAAAGHDRVIVTDVGGCCPLADECQVTAELREISAAGELGIAAVAEDRVIVGVGIDHVRPKATNDHVVAGVGEDVISGTNSGICGLGRVHNRTAAMQVNASVVAKDYIGPGVGSLQDRWVRWLHVDVVALGTTQGDVITISEQQVIAVTDCRITGLDPLQQFADVEGSLAIVAE